MSKEDASPQDLFYTKDPSVSRRDEIYLQILNHGLHHIRGAASNGDFKHCEIESDHLHNIPSYVAGGDAANHLYYLTKEIPFYLKQTDLSNEGNQFYINMYIPLWIELEGLVPIEGSPWASEWQAIKTGGWNYGRKGT